jgi:hypothetical protein
VAREAHDRPCLRAVVALDARRTPGDDHRGAELEQQRDRAGDVEGPVEPVGAPDAAGLDGRLGAGGAGLTRRCR